MQIALIDAITFVISASIYYLLPKVDIEKHPDSDEQKKNAWSAFFSIIKKHPNIGKYCFYMILSTALFQGYHTVARTVIPLNMFSFVGKTGVMYYQIISSIGLILGSVFAYHFLAGKKKIVIAPSVFIFATAILLYSTVLFNNFIAALIVYFIFIFVFEISYIVYMNYILANTPHEKGTLSTVMSFLSSAMLTLMVIVVLLTGKLMDILSLHITATTLAVSGPMIILFYLLFKKRTKRGLG
jgi:MFS family permease